MFKVPRYLLAEDRSSIENKIFANEQCLKVDLEFKCTEVQVSIYFISYSRNNFQEQFIGIKDENSILLFF